MKKLEKIGLIDKVGRELQSRMSFSEIKTYFDAYGIPSDKEPSSNSKWVYVKETLGSQSEEIILEIATELNIDHPHSTSLANITGSDANFWKPGHFKLFISHLASFKSTVSKLKDELENYGISAFVAHEDIEPTREWQSEIERGLFSMDALCAILMPKFKESNWTDQEIGVAIGRDVLVIPIRRELDPYGFIGKYQGFQAVGKNIGQVAEGIFQIISTHDKTKTKFITAITELFLLANSFDEGQKRLAVIKKIKNLSEEKVVQLHKRIVENKNLKPYKILKEFNALTALYNLPNLTQADFEQRKDSEADALPF